MFDDPSSVAGAAPRRPTRVAAFDGHRFESPQLHQEVRASERGFPPPQSSATFWSGFRAQFVEPAMSVAKRVNERRGARALVFIGRIAEGCSPSP
jgi:hypothetical protein